MLDQLLPHRIDNRYAGRRLALWLLGVLLLAKAAMSLSTIFNGRQTATRADGIPLETYPPAAARTVLSIFALLGFWQLILCVLGVLVLVRYRAMTPLLFALFLLQYVGGRVILRAMPIARAGTPPGPFVNLTLLLVMIAGLALSLWRRPNVATQE